MKDEFLFASPAGIGIEFLGIFTCAKSAERDGLGLAALEERRAMRARQH